MKGNEMKRLALASLVALASLLSFAEAAEECGTLAFAYQGVLKEASGRKLDRQDFAVEFRIYDRATGGSPKWGLKLPVRIDDDGLFSVRISDADSPDKLIEGVPGSGLARIFAEHAGTPLYVGLTVVGSRAEIVPRQKLLATPYASYAADASAARQGMDVAKAASAADAEIKGRVAAREVSAASGMAAESVAVGGAISAAGGTIPLGGIITWSGPANKIPYGWALCDGQISHGRRTPDLRGRFIVGAGTGYPSGSTGGEASHKLAAQEMPAHTHGISAKTVGFTLRYNDEPEAVTHDGNSKNNGLRTIASTEAGEGQEHENRPPFYALCYIMRVR